MALTTVVEQAVGLGVTAMHIFEDGIIALPFAAVPLLTVRTATLFAGTVLGHAPLTPLGAAAAHILS